MMVHAPALALILLPGLTILRAADVSLAEAVQATLADQPGVQINRQQVEDKRGQLKTAGGLFDWMLDSTWSRQTSHAPTGLPPPGYAVDATDTDTYSLGFTKLLRNGISITPQVSVTDFTNHGTSAPTLLSPLMPPASESDASVTITVPLLRGLGTRVVDANEIAAHYGLQSQENLTRFQVEQLVFQTVSAYWDCLAARRNLEILTDVEEHTAQVVKIVEMFAAGGELDRAALDQVHALAATKQTARQDGELEFFQSRQALALAMGCTAGQLADAPKAGGEYPEVLDAGVVGGLQGQKLVSEAMAHRGDYAALGFTVQAQQALFDRARNNLKPQLDLRLGAGYAGLDASDARLRPAYALTNNLAGANVFTSLNIAWPTSNNAARGALISQRAVLEQFRLNTVQLGETIASDVLTTIETLRKTAAQYGTATEAVDTYRRAVAQTTEKLKLGEATLTELSDLEDRNVAARQGQNGTLHDYAIALARLRLVTGTLLVKQGHQAIIDVHTLTEIPFPSASP
jgi:outer membrane protein TolC